MWSPALEERTSKTVGPTWNSTTRPPAAAVQLPASWKSSHQWYPSSSSCYYNDNDFERLFLPGHDSIIPSFRLNFSGQSSSWYSNQNPLGYESAASTVHPQHHHMLVAHNDPTATGSSCSPKTRDMMMTVPTSLIQQEEYDGLEEIQRKVDETTAVVDGGDGDQVVGYHHRSFISSLVLEEWPLLGDGDDEEDREDTTLGLSDQDKWELKLLFSTIHDYPEQDRSGAWLSSPRTAREDAGGSCSNYYNDSSHLISSIYNDTSLLVGETTTKPDSAISQDASCEDDLPTGYHASHHTSTPTHQEVQSRPKDDRLKPISTSSTLETIVLSDCSLSRNDSLAAQPSSDTKEQYILDNPVEVIHRDLPGVGDSCSTSSRFRIYQEDQWIQQYSDLKEFAKKTGHTFVPCGYPDRDSLARWTKRQRYQYKLRAEGKVSTMTKERIALLDELGFIWNSQVAVWERRLGELKHYKRLTGHCNVPSHFSPNQKLATWVKASD